ncbi:aminotransferase class IV [Candidatus Peregrinibacteria bacterium]|nr:aminotransferase class IV [Candidatus Peregrinibacteria bacterium]
MVVYLNGKFVEARDAKIPAFDPGFLYGDGIFETLRTYNGQIWQMEEHLERLYESARMRGWKLVWKPKTMAELIEKTLKKNNYPESRIRVTITPGLKQPTLFIWVQPLDKIPASAYSCGVSAITFPLERVFPQMKTTSIQHLLIARDEVYKRRAFEALLINHKGYITEGTWTNVFIIRKKKLITPRLGVLLGTTRSTVLKLAKPLLRIKFKDITRRELMNADECFLTNAPKGIVPVVKIDGEKIGTGRRGPVTRHLQKEFDKKVAKP